MRAAAFVACLLLSSALASGCKGDREKCAVAAQRYAELIFWDRENAEIAKLPAEQRDAERKRKLLEFNREIDSQLDFRVRQCVGAGNDEQADCIIKAKTAAEARDCAEIAKSE
jgi:hypothetical protein